MRVIKYSGFENGKKVFGTNGEITDESGKQFRYSLNAFFDLVQKGLITNVCEFTGLEDKNKEEIYEGDVVRILYTDWMSQHLGTDEQKAMTLEEYLISISIIDEVIYFVPEFTLKGGEINAGKHGFIEVIGNIYENEELIE